MSKSNQETIFGKMISGKVPNKFIYEDDLCVAFDDINPTGKFDLHLRIFISDLVIYSMTAPVHFLVIPRKPIRQLSEATEEDQLVWVIF